MTCKCYLFTWSRIKTLINWVCILDTFKVTIGIQPCGWNNAVLLTLNDFQWYQFQKTFCENLSGALRNKICSFLRQGICIYVGHSFLRNTLRPIVLFWVGNSCVEGRELNCFNAITWWEVAWFYILTLKDI